MLAELARDSGRGPEVGAVGVVQFDLYGAFRLGEGRVRLFVQLRLTAGEPGFKLVVVEGGAKEVEKKFFVYFYFGHVGFSLLV